MNQNVYWKALLTVIGMGTLWFTYLAISLWYGYISLDTAIMPKNIEWTVKPISEEVFYIQAEYHFQWKGNDFSGTSQLEDHSFRNSWAAEKAIDAYKKLSWPVWFSSSHPKYSSLQKNFPLKECLSALVLWGLVIYFIGLQHYVKLMQR